MIIYLAMEVARKLNMFPPKGGISTHFSPRAILHQEPLDYHRHCLIPFGTYIQAHDDSKPKNTPQARTLDGIYLRLTSNQQGGHEFLDLATKRVKTRKYVTTIPITKHVIAAVEAMAEAEEMKGFRVRTAAGTILYDSSWTAGVDYDDNSDNDSVLDNQQDDEDDDSDEVTADSVQDDQSEQVEDQESQPDEQLSVQESSESEPDEQWGESGNNNRHSSEAIPGSPVQAGNEEEDHEDPESRGTATRTTRAGRASRPYKHYEPTLEGQSYSHLQHETADTYEYDDLLAKVIASIMVELSERLTNTKIQHTAISF
jgi:hypothetical protein